MPLFRRRPRRVGAVLSTLGHATDLAATIGGDVSADRVVVSSGARVLLGWSIAESAGSLASVRLRDGVEGATPVHTVLAAIALAANGGDTQWFADEGIEVKSGAISLEVVGGTVTGVVFWG